MPSRKRPTPADLLSELDALDEDPGQIEVDIPPARPRRSKQQQVDTALRSEKPRRSAEKTPRSSRVSSGSDDPLDFLTPKPGARGCYGINLLNEPCGRTPLNKGTKLRDKKGKEWPASGDFCIFHDPALPEARDLNMGGAQANAGRKKKVNPMELMSRAFEESAGLFIAPYLQTLGLMIDPSSGAIVNDPNNDGAMLFGTSKDGDVYVSEHVDLGAQVKVAEMLQDRIFGKPKQATEVTGKDGKDLVVEVPMTPERVAAVSAVLKSVGALPQEKGKKK